MGDYGICKKLWTTRKKICKEYDGETERRILTETMGFNLNRKRPLGQAAPLGQALAGGEWNAELTGPVQWKAVGGPPRKQRGWRGRDKAPRGFWFMSSQSWGRQVNPKERQLAGL